MSTGTEQCTTFRFPPLQKPGLASAHVYIYIECIYKWQYYLTLAPTVHGNAVPGVQISTRIQNAGIQKSNMPKIQNPKIQQSKNLKIQKSKNPKIQKSKNPKIQQSNNPKIQKSKNKMQNSVDSKVLDFWIFGF